MCKTTAPLATISFSQNMLRNVSSNMSWLKIQNQQECIFGGHRRFHMKLEWVIGGFTSITVFHNILNWWHHYSKIEPKVFRSVYYIPYDNSKTKVNSYINFVWEILLMRLVFQTVNMFIAITSCSPTWIESSPNCYIMHKQS